MVRTDGNKHKTKALSVLEAAGRICVLHLLAFGVTAHAVLADAHPQETGSTVRMVTAEQGRQIAEAAREQDEPVRGTQDCSHLVHQIYSDAGYGYAYVSSFDLYAGNENFRRVRHPQAGDLIIWPGHVGIVINPRQHSFHSLVRSGLRTEDYLGPYWRARGTPRFYRYVVDSSPNVETARATRPTPPSPSESLHKGSSENPEMRAQSEKRTGQEAPEEASLRSKVLAAPRVPASVAEVSTVPSSILITPEQRRPTAAEAFDKISELSSNTANVLRTAEPLRVTSPVVILDEFHVERIETKRDKGWVHLQIESHVRIADEGVDFKRRREKVRWELRRDASGWTAIAPAERAFVGRNEAVRVLSAQLAEMAASDAAAKHDEILAGQEARIVNVLGALLEKK
jgi:hypothetical protein